MHRFFVPPDKIVAGQAELQEADAHHLRSVMRLGPGDNIVVFDGTGREYRAAIRSFEGRQVRVDLLAQSHPPSESNLDLALAQAFLKEKKMEGLIRPLTELGVTRWIPFQARRSIATPDPRRLALRQARWRKIGLEALKQCRRNRPMAIEEAVAFETVLRLAEPYPLKIIFWENEPLPLGPPPVPRRPGGVFLLIGPEGGFESGEVEQARAAGFRAAGLGPRILRAETATLSAAALAQFLWGDMGAARAEAAPE